MQIWKYPNNLKMLAKVGVFNIIFKKTSTVTYCFY